MTIDEHIEELRAELKWCADADEFVQIEAQLRAALAERAGLDEAFEQHD